MWRCRWLGTIAVEHTDGRTDGARLLGQPKRLAILAYLTLPVPGTWHRRTTLLRIFYPDREPSHGRNALRNALHALRTVLGDQAVLTRGDEAVCISRDELSTDVGALAPGSPAAGELLPDLEGQVGSPEFAAWLAGERRRIGRAADGRPIAAGGARSRPRRTATVLGAVSLGVLLLILLLNGRRGLPTARAAAETGQQPEAARLVAAALHVLGKEDLDGLDQAKALYLRAVDADPTYGPAFTGLGRTWMYLANAGRVPRQQAVGMMRDALTRAARFSDSLDPDLLDGRAYLVYVEGNAAEAERLKQLAIVRAPERAEFREHLAHLLVLEGRLAEGRAQLDTAMMISPLERRFPEAAAYLEGCRGNDAEAVRLLRASLAIDSSNAQAWLELALASVRLGHWGEALDAWAHWDDRSFRRHVPAVGSDSARFAAGWDARRRERTAASPRRGAGAISPLDQVLGLAWGGEGDSALSALGSLRTDDPLALGYALCAEALRPYHADPRFRAAFRGTRFEAAFFRVVGGAPVN